MAVFFPDPIRDRATILEQQIASHAENLAIMMLASTLGMDVDEALDTDEAARALAADGRIASHDAICAVAEGDPEGRWTCVVAAAVLVMEWMLPKNE